jgi:hypothetical protein
MDDLLHVGADRRALRVLPHRMNKLAQEAIDAWEARPERQSWEAHRIRDLMISNIRMAATAGLPMIKTLVALCPLLGLLGTVTGMIEVFDVMAVTGTGNARAMASGVSKATVPTMAGMVGALSGVLFASILTSWANRRVALSKTNWLRITEATTMRSMFEAAGTEEEESEINITPMLDVVFIMLIFFIVTASFVKEAGIDVNRPDAETAVRQERANILIAISENNEIWIDQRRWTRGRCGPTSSACMPRIRRVRWSSRPTRNRSPRL